MRGRNRFIDIHALEHFPAAILDDDLIFQRLMGRGLRRQPFFDGQREFMFWLRVLRFFISRRRRTRYFPLQAFALRTR